MTEKRIPRARDPLALREKLGKIAKAPSKVRPRVFARSFKAAPSCSQISISPDFQAR